MFTFFASCHPFTGQMESVQRHAIRSWQALPCEKEIMLIGNETGMAEAAADMGLIHIPVPTDYTLGTFFCDEEERLARKYAKGDLLIHIMADLIAMPSLVPVLLTLYEFSKEHPKMLGVARGADVTEHELANPYRGELYVFRPESETWWPHVLVGRPRADNAIIYRALLRGMQLVDFSWPDHVFHQPHKKVVKMPLWVQGRDFNREEARAAAGVHHSQYQLKKAQCGYTIEKKKGLALTSWERIGKG